MKFRSKRNYNFKCSLDLTDITPLTAKWDSNKAHYSVVINEAVLKVFYVSAQGNQGTSQAIANYQTPTSFSAII